MISEKGTREGLAPLSFFYDKGRGEGVAIFSYFFLTRGERWVGQLLIWADNGGNGV